MSGFYSLPEPRVWRGRSRTSETSYPDPYGPSSPDYRERHRLTRREVASGLVLESLGAPIGEPVQSHAKPYDYAPEANPAPVTDTAMLSARSSVPSGEALPEYKPGLGRG